MSGALPRLARLHSVAAWLGLALCAGAALGLAGRLAMRVVAWQADLTPGFSAGGTLEVVLFGVLVGAPVALTVWMCRWLFPLPPWIGTLVGVVLFSVLAAWQPPAAQSALQATPDTQGFTAVIFLAVFIAYGCVVDVLWRVQGANRLHENDEGSTQASRVDC